jgi:ABC-type transport system involved in cytochrome bd biosynthesis fused ATPase/permease subunit
MDILPRNKEASVNLPRQKGVALCLQTGWIMEGTVRENILFGSAYNEVRYRQVLHQCALLPDLKLWEAGDLTELGEKGLTAR